MAIIRQATKDDLDAIHQLICEEIRPVNRDVFECLFGSYWDNQSTNYGFILSDDNTVVGYLGVVYAERLMNGDKQIIANLSSWAVKVPYRKQSLLLLMRILKEKEWVLTSFTPHPVVVDIFKAFKFDVIDTHMRVFPFYLSVPGCWQSVQILLGYENLKNVVSDEALRLINDHRDLPCEFGLLQSKDKNCLFAFTRVIKKNVPFCQIHYIEDSEIFFCYYQKVILNLLIRHKVAGLMIDERYMAERKPLGSIRIALPSVRMAKLRGCSPAQIDGLYSETVLMGI